MGLSNNVLLKDDIDNLVGKDSRISSNRLPARVSSFEHMKNEWRKHLSEIAKPVVNMEPVVEQSVAEVSTVQPVNVPAEPVVEVSAVQPVNVPAEPVVEVSAVQPVNVPAEPVVEVSAVQPVNVPAEPVVEVSAVQPVNVPADEQKNVVMTAEVSSFLTQLVARLEEKVNILAVDNIPTNLVKGRAIRLRENMYNSLVSNSGGIYSVELVNAAKDNQSFVDVKDVALASENVNDNVVSETPHEEVVIDVQKVSDDNKDEIVSDINDAMNNVSDMPLVDEKSSESENDVVENTVDSVPVESEPEESVVPVETTKFEEEPIEPIVPVETVKMDRDPVIVVEERTETPKVVQEKEEVQPNSSENVEITDASFDTEDKSVSTLDVLEKLTTAKMLYQKSLDELNDAKKKKAVEEDEAQKAVRERIEALARLKDMKEKVRLACEEFNQKAENNRTSAVSILEGVDKMKTFIGDQKVAADDYNAQLEKIVEALGDGVIAANLKDDNSVDQDKVERRM